MKLLILIMKFLMLTFAITSGDKIVKVKCKGTKLWHWNYVGELQTCDTGADTKVLTSNSVVDNLSNNNKIEAIIFEASSEVHFIPRGLKKNFPNLTTLYFQSQPMKTLSSDELEQFGSDLQFLRAIDGKITYLTKNMFVHNQNLKYIDFEGNPLKYIEGGFFENIAKLHQLKEIEMTSCSCIDRRTNQKIDVVTWIHTCNNRSVVPNAND